MTAHSPRSGSSSRSAAPRTPIAGVVGETHSQSGDERQASGEAFVALRSVGRETFGVLERREQHEVALAARLGLDVLGDLQQQPDVGDVGADTVCL